MPPLEFDVIAGGQFPDPLVEGARSVLRKYGYRHLEEGESRDDWAEMWELLRADFVSTAERPLPSFVALSEAAREAARDYMRRRLIADHLLDKCQEAHATLFSAGISTGHVEAYSVVRESYEHSVEAFGAAREEVERLLGLNTAG